MCKARSPKVRWVLFPRAAVIFASRENSGQVMNIFLFLHKIHFHLQFIWSNIGKYNICFKRSFFWWYELHCLSDIGPYWQTIWYSKVRTTKSYMYIHMYTVYEYFEEKSAAYNLHLNFSWRMLILIEFLVHLRTSYIFLKKKINIRKNTWFFDMDKYW